MNRTIALLPRLVRQGTRKASTNIPPGHIEAKYPDLSKIKKFQAQVQVDIEEPVFLKFPRDKIIFAISCFTTAIASGQIVYILYELGKKYAK